MIEDGMKIFYSCEACNLEDVLVKVRYRSSDEDIRVYFDMVITPALYNDHKAKSPTCHPESLKNVKIPIANAQWVGGPPIQ